MADNDYAKLNKATIPGGENISVDRINSRDYQRVKLIHGVSGTNDGDVANTNPLPVNDPWIQHAIDIIKAEDGVTVSIQAKNKDLLKFGRNPLVGTSSATVMDLPSGILNETYVSDNLITTVSSSNTGDTQSVVVEGHTIDGNGDFTFVTQTLTLTGQTQFSLATPLARCTRLYNNDSTDFAGNIYVYQDDTSTAGVPDTNAKVHLIVPTGSNQSRKAATTLSNVDYWLVFDFDADIYDKQAGFAEVTLEVREKGKVFRQKESVAVRSGGHSDHNFRPYQIVKPNSDIRLTAVADGANTDVGGMVQGVLLTTV